MPARAQVARDVVVVRRRAGAHVDDEDDRVGLGDRLLGLARHLATMPVGFSGSKPPVSTTMNSWPPTMASP